MTIEKYTPDNYRLFVDTDIFYNMPDYSGKTGLFKALKVSYPADYYAMPCYLTTRILNKIFLSSDRTQDGFIKAVNDYVMI